MNKTDLLFNPNLVIENDDVSLRIVSMEDISSLEKIAIDKSIWTYFTDEINSLDDLQKYVKSLLTQFEDHKNVPFVIYDKKKQKIVGMSSFGNISAKDQRIEIGWSWITPTAQGSGINKAYKDLLINFAFEKLEFVRVEFKTDVLNAKARKALEKIGATEEGVLRSHTLMHHNRRRDTIYYAILRDEWKS
ncbi:GNAT family N-acetyltransferase [Kordia sp.]|uniref:GNAT family N-acetyltransferase n=1 Tax=Kordia sp. TaxID=1965332 RepID=UPI003D28E2AE